MAFEQFETHDDESSDDNGSSAPCPLVIERPAGAGRQHLHRAAPADLPADVVEAVGAALDLIEGDAMDRSSAFEALSERIARLASPEGDALVHELAAHLPVLAAMGRHYLRESLEARTSEARIKFGKLALQCESSHLRTSIAVAGLLDQKAGRAKVLVTVDELTHDDFTM